MLASSEIAFTGQDSIACATAVFSSGDSGCLSTVAGIHFTSKIVGAVIAQTPQPIHIELTFTVIVYDI
jgi:hypothetical protein